MSLACILHWKRSDATRFSPNAIGLPGITIPNGFGARGLPTALEFTGRAYDENAILAAARAYQQRTDWHTKTPKIE